MPEVAQANKEKLILSCVDVADYFIGLANDTGSFISNLKLQKLVYYAQAWHLALYGSPLIEEDFQAWIHGPVLPALYTLYKSFGCQPIVQETNLAEQKNIPPDTLSFLKEVADEYFACDAFELEQMTHAEDPWRRARVGLAADDPSTRCIEKAWMKEYYGSRVEEN